MERLFRWETMLLKHLTCWKIKMVQWLHRKRIVPVMPKGSNLNINAGSPNQTILLKAVCNAHLALEKKWYFMIFVYSTVSLRADTDKLSIKITFPVSQNYLHAFCPANFWSLRTHRFGPAIWHFIKVVHYVLLSKNKQQIRDPWIPLGGWGGGVRKNGCSANRPRNKGCLKDRENW